MQNHLPEQLSPGFASLGLDHRLVTVLTSLNYAQPTPIQRAAIPSLLEGHDLLGQAATGTGKTAAFSLPIIHRLAADAHRGPLPSVLILVPTRELANQVADSVHSYGKNLNIRVTAIYGGQSYEPQIKALKRGTDIVVATPGRALDHMDRGTLNLSNIQALVLDEADEMLDLGFLEDIEALIAGTPDDRQMMLFSATMAPRIAAIAKRHLKNPVHVTIAKEKADSGSIPLIRQMAYLVPRSRKLDALCSLLALEDPSAAIIFCRTREDVDLLTETLKTRGHRAEALHGGMSQSQRERVLFRLKARQAELVVATDVAARGLDIEHLSHVVNFDLPTAPEAYVHRIGRVGRAGRKGTALTMTEPRERRMMQIIERITKQKIELGNLPTAQELEAKRQDATKAKILAAMQDPNLAKISPIVDSLATVSDLMNIALAAIKLLHGEVTETAPVTVSEVSTEPKGKNRPWERRRPKQARKGRGR